jgi:hypothetical protein
MVFFKKDSLINLKKKWANVFVFAHFGRIKLVKFFHLKHNSIKIGGLVTMIRDNLANLEY